MFQISTDQKICEVGGVKFGGQPGEYPCVCVNSIFQKGDRVMVVAGPFAGVVGTFSHFKGRERVIVEIDALGQFAAVDVDMADIEKLPDLKS